MLLAIDAGNTNIVFAVFVEDKLIAMWRMATVAQRTADEYATFLLIMMMEAGIDPAEVNSAIIGSVVPDANFHLQSLCENHFRCRPMIIGNDDVDVGLDIQMDNPAEVGADRLINAVSGMVRYGAPLILIDYGTATTFDVVDANGSYIGGAIAPGINLSLQALHMAAAKLPRIGVAQPRTIIGKNTVEAVQSGIFWGYVGLIEGMIGRLKAELGSDATVIATGGLATLFKDAVGGINHYDEDLTLFGLFLIHQRNQQLAENNQEEERT